jgi:hypothetical protein
VIGNKPPRYASSIAEQASAHNDWKQLLGSIATPWVLCGNILRRRRETQRLMAQVFLEGTRHKKDVAGKKGHKSAQTCFDHGISAFCTEGELQKLSCRSHIGLVAKYTGRTHGERHYVGGLA